MSAGQQISASYKIVIAPSVVLLIMNDNAADATTTFADESASAHTMTAVGNAQYDTAQAPTGMTSSGLFDGTGDYLTTPDSADWHLASGDFTIELWIRFNSVAATALIVQGDGATGNGSFFLDFGVGAANTLRFLYSTTGSYSPTKAISGAWTPSANTWYHVEVDRSGANGYLFVDGTQVGSTYNFSTDSLYNDTRVLAVASYSDGLAGYQVAGWMCSARITKGAALHTTNFTPPSLPLS